MRTALAMPDITPAQIVAVVGAVIGLAVAAGLDISQDLQDSIINLVTVLSGLLLVSDAAIRHGRSRALINAPKGEVAEDVDKGGTTLGGSGRGA